MKTDAELLADNCIRFPAERSREVLGRLAYEADVAAEPTYHDGSPRLTWEQLQEICRESWRRNPTSRRQQ